MDIALATAADLPNLDPDERLVIPELAALGVRAKPVVWQDDAFDWSTVRACVIRSTWGYFLERERFVAWAERVSRTTAIFNPANVVRWNTHKRYLADLEARGVKIVPTAFVDRGASVDLARLARTRGWRDVVVKPAVSAGAHATVRVPADAHDAGQSHLDAILANGDAMVQPYLASVEGRGERSIVLFDGKPSHAIRKHALLDGEPLVAPPHEAEFLRPPAPSVDATNEEQAFARAVLAAIPFETAPLLYARVDVARDDGGALALMELEAIEPSLFLAQGRAAARFAQAIAARVSGP